MRTQRRVEQLERLRRPAEPRFVFFTVRPDTWPEADRAAFDGDNRERRDEAIERHTGQRLGPYTRMIVIRHCERGPQ
jgi:hypothetical protein